MSFMRLVMKHTRQHIGPYLSVVDTMVYVLQVRDNDCVPWETIECVDFDKLSESEQKEIIASVT